MEPEGVTPVIEYVLAGEEAAKVCGRGFAALAAHARKGERAQDEPGFEVWTWGGRTWRITKADNDAYPAIVAEHERRPRSARIDWVRTVCAYGGGIAALNFAAGWGFTADQMRVETGRWETPQ